MASTGMKLLRFRLLFDHQDHRIIYRIPLEPETLDNQGFTYGFAMEE